MLDLFNDAATKNQSHREPSRTPGFERHRVPVRPYPVSARLHEVLHALEEARRRATAGSGHPHPSIG